MNQPPQDRLTLTITAEEAGERLDRILGARELGFSRSTLQRWIREGRVELEGRAVRASSRPERGDRVVVRPAPPPTTELLPQALALEVLFRDQHLAVVVKPAGMVVHPAAGHADGTLVNALLYHLGEPEGGSERQRPGIVHRLDAGTSGVMVVARSERAHAGLSELFARHDIERCYQAIALGHPEPSFTIRSLHGRHPVDRKRFSGRVQRGKPAVTHVQLQERLHGASLLQCRLETGRTHQIRVHLSEHGHALIGDPVYGHKSRDPRLRQAAEVLGRQALHAGLLGFAHPVTAEPLRFEVEPPEDFRRALQLLRGDDRPCDPRF
ncbi:MAG: RluA family pseudouridine synthase [Myxococcales bacterium]|nr:RluA family pseudouridine synthase [Myxococcales bacterium]